MLKEKRILSCPKSQMCPSDTNDEDQPLNSKIEVRKSKGNMWARAGTDPLLIKRNSEAQMKDLAKTLMESKYLQEERKEIMGEEWRNISQILDR